jgi:hypothetical protein
VHGEVPGVVGVYQTILKTVNGVADWTVQKTWGRHTVPHINGVRVLIARKEEKSMLVRNRILCYLVLVLIMILWFSGCSSDSSRADALFVQAWLEQEAGNFTVAKELYEQAEEAFLAEDRQDRARDCRTARQDMAVIELTYSLGEADLRGMLADAFPGVPEAEREAWIAGGGLEYAVIDGESRYFADVVPNIKFRNVDLFRQDAAMLDRYEQGYLVLKTIIDAGPGPDPWQPFINPVTYRGNGTLQIPRERLPKTGMLQLWFPIPIITGAQPAVMVTSITPERYVKVPPSIDEDIGLIYIEVDLDELREDLDIALEFLFDHYEQRFVVNPENIGDYDREGALYREYTASRGNIAVTPEIAEKAKDVVGNERNPWRAAKKLYDYVIENVQYSFMPHLALWPRGLPESVYVHENRHGDCGAQSMYFSALCRSVGIPARTTGGWQLFSGNFSGHFWAEFFAPNYGWIPVDPTAAEIVDYLTDVSDEDKRIFHDFFFGSQDHFRCNVQKDVDLPLVPPAKGRVLLPMVIQFPAALCDTMEEIPGIVIQEYWKLDATVM